MVEKALFSSKKEDWETPRRLFDQLDDEFHFNLDAAANKYNAKCGRWFDEEVDGLTQKWLSDGHITCGSSVIKASVPGKVWVNPPYGRDVGRWVEKAAQEVEKGNARLVVMLLPARTDTRWFHGYIYNKRNVEVRFLKGRLKFDGATNSAPFPSMVVIFRP